MTHGTRPARRLIRKVARRLRKALGMAGRGRRPELMKKIDQYQVPESVPALPQVLAAVAAGPSITAGFAWEWTQREFSAANWSTVLAGATEKPDVVMVEAPDGRPVLAGSWDAVRTWAGEQGIPVVVWATGDLTSPDAAGAWVPDVHLFVDQPEVLEKWRAAWPAATIDVLLPAVQPRLHNPRHGGNATRRQEAAAVLMHGESAAIGELAEVDGTILDVWASGKDAETAAAASPLRASLLPRRRLPADNPVLAKYRVLAEVGKTAQAPSWTVTMAAGCQTPVVLEQEAAERLPQSLREHVVVAENSQDLRLETVARLWQGELRDREGVRLGRAALAEHTFSQRAEGILRAAGRPVERPRKPVSAIVPTNRLHELDNILFNVGRQAYRHDGGVELVLVLHGLDVHDAEVRAKAADAGVQDLQIVHADSSYPLGKCMNLGVDAAQGAYLAKMDDDNIYGEHYLTDLVAAFSYTDAGIVGKWAHYVWLRATGAVVLRAAYAEHRYERLVQGGSIVLTAEVARELRFGDHLPRGVDTDLLNRAADAGVRTYSADRFNYVSLRGSNRHAHTWTITEAALLNRAGTLAFYGDPRSHVEI